MTTTGALVTSKAVKRAAVLTERRRLREESKIRSMFVRTSDVIARLRELLDLVDLGPPEPPVAAELRAWLGDLAHEQPKLPEALRPRGCSVCEVCGGCRGLNCEHPEQCLGCARASPD